jgi:hypothetical protein
MNEESFNMNETIAESSVGAKSANPCPLTFRLRPKVTMGRQGAIPNMGEVELENSSNGPLEIAYTMTPLQFLELEVRGPAGKVVSEGHFSDRFSPTLEPAVLRLMPGEKFTANVSLLATVPCEKRPPGQYVVQGSYRFQDVRVMAETVMIELTH